MLRLAGAGRLAAAWLAAVFGVAHACAPALAHGHDWSPWMGRPATERKHFQGNQFERAGNPQCISPLAKAAESGREIGYYVGGGARVHARAGEPRRSGDGTWGVDYEGIIIPKNNALHWWHGSRYQGGIDGYRTDGPRVLHRP